MTSETKTSILKTSRQLKLIAPRWDRRSGELVFTEVRDPTTWLILFAWITCVAVFVVGSGLTAVVAAYASYLKPIGGIIFVPTAIMMAAATALASRHLVRLVIRILVIYEIQLQPECVQIKWRRITSSVWKAKHEIETNKLSGELEPFEFLGILDFRLRLNVDTSSTSLVVCEKIAEDEVSELCAKIESTMPMRIRWLEKTAA